MPKLTKRLIDAAETGLEASEVFLWDTEVKGFGLRVKPSGGKSFVLKYRIGTQTKRHTIGKVGSPYTVDEARKIAADLLRDIRHGADPAAEKRQAKEVNTVAELCEAYLEAARAGLVMTRFRRPKKASTIAIDEGRVLRHITPLIGRTSARDLTREIVQRMADDIAKGKTAGTFAGKTRGKAVVEGGTGTAARVVELLGGIWTWAEKRGHVSGPNPARGVEKHLGEAKDRTLSAEELKRLGNVLKERERTHPMVVAAVRLIALTGMRREEACGLRWSEIDEIGPCLRLEATKTGRSTRPISKSVLELLRSLPRPADGDRGGWVFPNRDGSGSADFKKLIAGIFDAAGLADARAHDLRRTFASVAANDEGLSDATIGELLGHARKGVTERHYIRRPDAALVAAADRVAARIAAAINGREAAAEVVPLRRA